MVTLYHRLRPYQVDPHPLHLDIQIIQREVHRCHHPRYRQHHQQPKRLHYRIAVVAFHQYLELVLPPLLHLKLEHLHLHLQARLSHHELLPKSLELPRSRVQYRGMLGKKTAMRKSLSMKATTIQIWPLAQITKTPSKPMRDLQALKMIQ